MPLLFSYGTLREESVQLATFGRILSGKPDELPRYEPSCVPVIEPEVLASGRTHYDNVTFNGRGDSRIAGMVFEVTADELQRADEYERPAGYVRRLVTLASGKEAWVYVADGEGATADEALNDE